MSEGKEQHKLFRNEQDFSRWKLETLQYHDDQLALFITGERGTKFDWNKFKWTPNEPEEEGIVSTLSGNDYYIYTDWERTHIVDTRQSETTGRLVAAYQYFPAVLPPIAFGEPWRIPGFFTTSDVQSILIKYKIGSDGHKIDEPVPFEKYRHYFRKPAR